MTTWMRNGSHRSSWIARNAHPRLRCAAAEAHRDRAVLARTHRYPGHPLDRYRQLFLIGVVVALLSWMGAYTAASAQATDTSANTYAWSAELVELDEMGSMMTVKALMVGQEMTDWTALSRGDQAVLTWSGITSASGVRFISQDEAHLENARLRLPVEFISFETDNRYVTFRVPIPESEVANLRSLEPGEWVTATSPRDVSSTAEPVAAIRPYTLAG